MPYPLFNGDICFTVGEQQVSKKGAKFCDIKVGSETPSYQLSTTPLYSPFQAGVYNGTGEEQRVNLDLSVDGELMQLLQSYDEIFKEALRKYSKATYHPIVQQSGDHPARIRCKVKCSGPGACRLWAGDKTPLGDIRKISTVGAYVIPIVSIGRAWFMGGLCGVSLELKAAVITEAAPDFVDDFPL